MTLFKNDQVENLLPHDGVVTYHGRILNYEDALAYYQKLLHSYRMEK
jgi:hypothetical protein